MTADATTSELRSALASFEARARELGASDSEAAKLLRRMRKHTDRLASYRAEQAQEAAEAAAEEARRASALAGASEGEEKAAAAAAAARAAAAEEAARVARAEAWSARLWNDPPSTATTLPAGATLALEGSKKKKKKGSSRKTVSGATPEKTEAESDVDAFIAHMQREALLDEERTGREDEGEDELDEREQRALWLSLGKDKEKLALPLPASDAPRSAS